MSRISNRRASPENWERTVKRMASLNQVSLTPADARAIVKYLSDHNGLAPEEARPAAFEAERRMTEWTYTADKDTAALCTGCHSFGRVMTERRTEEEWGLLVAMHRGYYPLIDNQPIANGTGFRRNSALPNEPAAPNAPPPDTRQPMEKAIAHLSKAFPLVTPEWSAWSAASAPPRLAGRWALSGSLLGKGPVFGEVVITADAAAPDEFTTQTRYTIAHTGQSVSRTGKGLVYTGFQWRGRGFEAGNTTDAWREVMFVERDQQEMSGRWMTGAYDEIGLDVKLVRLAGGPMVLGATPPSLKTGTTGRTVQVFGANLPGTLRPEDVSLGQGVKVTRIASANAGSVTLEVDVAADARPGPRDIAVAGVVRPSSLVVYSTVDGIRVTPRAGLARVGGTVFPKQLQPFEAVAFSNGPDGKPDTEDDWSLGLVDVKWSVEEYTATFGDTDIQYVGRIDQTGMFTPNFDGPNPDRPGNRNNIGDVWVVAEYTPEGSPRVLRGRAQLVVTVPVYMQWPSEVGR
jgi:quinohemoprotein amine dehydrogenase